VIRKALTSQSPALSELFIAQVVPFFGGGGREILAAFLGDSDSIASANTVTTAAAADVQFNALSMSQEIEIGLADLGVVAFAAGFEENSHEPILDP
jgi:hypothetical protein